MKIQNKSSHITIFESALYRTTTTLMHLDDCTIVVDPNFLSYEIEFIREYLNKVNFNKPIVLIFTHSDFDHIIGYKAFDADHVITSKKFTQQHDIENKLKYIQRFDDEFYIQRPYSISYPKPDIIITKNKEKITFSKTQLTFYLSPGHTEDGLFFVVEPYGYLIAGDYLSNVEIPFIEDDYAAYLKTLNKLEESINCYKIKLLVPGHGDSTGSVQDMKKRLDFSRRYINDALKEACYDLKIESSFIEASPFIRTSEKAHQQNLVQIKKQLRKKSML